MLISSWIRSFKSGPSPSGKRPPRRHIDSAIQSEILEDCRLNSKL